MPFDSLVYPRCGLPKAQAGAAYVARSTLAHFGSIHSGKTKISDESAGIGDIKRHAPILTGIGAVTGRDRREQTEGPRCIFRLCLPKNLCKARYPILAQELTRCGSRNGFTINPTQTFCLMLQSEPTQNRVARRRPESAAERFVAQKHSNGQNQFSLIVRSYEKPV